LINRDKEAKWGGNLMKDVCFGFEVHQPFRLNRHFAPDPKLKRKDIPAHYFDALNREVLEQASEQCYVPATEIVLEKLDQGFSCAFSLSGTLIEQLEKWQPDLLSLFECVATHRNCELLGQTYYHSIAGCFGDKSEFIQQARMHSDLMYDLFNIHPRVFVNTELALNNQIATLAKEMGFTGIFTEGVDRILCSRSLHQIYTCQDMPVLLRDVQLSDDIALRFANANWDKYPLTADTYAGWLAATWGDLTNIFLDYETFGYHLKEETGILEFLTHLPGELEGHGVKSVLPTDALLKHAPVGTIDLRDTISRAEIEKDSSAWMGNERQHTAFSAVQKAAFFAREKSIWRYLQTSDHFYSMAPKNGAFGEAYSYFSHHEADDAFKTYMAVLADFEKRNIRAVKNRKSARTLRTLTPEEAFYFASPYGYVGYTAYSLDQFSDLLIVVPADSIAYHQERDDIAYWIEDTLGDEKLALGVRNCVDRQDLISEIDERRELLWSHLK
jgi:alpha-amylase